MNVTVLFSHLFESQWWASWDMLAGQVTTITNQEAHSGTWYIAGHVTTITNR